jgi:gamma-glutamyltranspeptidase / glutathione hydrolase
MRTFSKSLIILFAHVSIIFCQIGLPKYSKNGMVVSANSIASDVGTEILKKGGNAIDAAVATGFALAVTFPGAGNIGGGGFMVLHLANGKNTTIDFRETAPSNSTEKMFLDSAGNFLPDLSQEGWTSTGVPGTVAGLIYTLNKYGTMKLREVIQPAIELARNGFILDHYLTNSLNNENTAFNKHESSKKVFTKNGERLKEGELFIQKDLSHTLELIRDGGADSFYKGTVAKIFVEQSRKHGGIFTEQDFAEYKPEERIPVTGEYHGYKIVSMPPPSSGGICLIEALNILEHFNFRKEEWGSSRYIHTLVETMKQIYADRAEHLGDPDFYPVPTTYLISKAYSEQVKAKIGDHARSALEVSAAKVPEYYEHQETTHYSVADKNGNVASTTYTLNGWYGNKIVVEGLGFILNNEMDDFSAKPGTANQFGLIGAYANRIQPKKRMLSSMTPTIVLKDGKPVMVIGSPGGSTIITSVLQVILNVLDFGMNINEAIGAPHIHYQLYPDQIDYEPFGLAEDVKNNLISRGHKIGEQRSLGRIEGIYIDHKNNCFFGTSDPRGYGKASGY